MAVLEAMRNGTVPLRVNTVDISLDEIGYPGWVVSMRINPRVSVHDDFVSVDETRFWAAFGKLVQSWNFADEDGRPFPLPSECASEAELDLPVHVLGFIFRRYIEEFRVRAGLPKVPDDNSVIGSAIAAAPRTDE
jgi:hypothetical protein